MAGKVSNSDNDKIKADADIFMKFSSGKLPADLNTNIEKRQCKWEEWAENTAHDIMS